MCIIHTYQEVFLAADVGNIHVVCRRAEIFELLASEDVESNKMDLSVAMLASLRGGHIDNLARASLDDNKSVLPQSRTLHGVGGRCTSIGGFEGVVMLSKGKNKQQLVKISYNLGIWSLGNEWLSFFCILPNFSCIKQEQMKK